MMGKDVEEVSASLVREYLSRKGLKKTIARMDEELPRTNSSINNRSDLRRILHLEDFRDLLTAINIHLLHRLSESSVSQVIVPSRTPSEIMRKSFAVHPDSERSEYCSSSSQDSLLTVSKEGFPSEKKVVDTDSQKNRSSRIRRGIMAGPIASPFTGDECSQSDMISVLSCLIQALKEIIFGSPLACFTEEWKQQNFTFSDTPGLKYGIVQKKGGPCGVLAAVQACVLQKLLFEESSNDSLVSNVLRTKCLSQALADILWRAGNMKRATVAISLFTPVGRYKSDGILEMITYVTMETLDDLTSVLEQHIRQFESGPFGCILLTVSAILSRTIATIQSDMDVPTSTLIGAHGYCTQELVNLLLCGWAVSNVFDDEMKLDSGNGNFTLLKGIKAHCNIGLLSLFEHYNICKVGSHLKTPKFPIWVVCSESHFSVLFCPSEDLATDHCREEEFDLYYYDGLANQQEPIRLTVCESFPLDSDLIPPLELCIRTK
uniref:Ubiquitin carboxyl-terminal hydrolase MINDY n=1 Tax=Cyprinus carpio carpio TaxID=630221 RepID=A0A9J8BT78_CYPCA